MSIPLKETRIYAWSVTDQFGDIIRLGVVTDFVEFSLDNLPFGWDGDRCLDAVQDTMMKQSPEWSEQKLVFSYKVYTLDANLSIREVDGGTEEVVMDRDVLEKKLKKLGLTIDISGSDMELTNITTKSVVLIFERPDTEAEMANAIKGALDIQIAQDEPDVSVGRQYVKYLKRLRTKLFA